MTQKSKPNPKANDVTRMIEELGDQTVGDRLGVTREQAGKWRRAGKMPEGRKAQLLHAYQGASAMAQEQQNVVPIRGGDMPMPTPNQVPALVPVPVDGSDLRAARERRKQIEKQLEGQEEEEVYRWPWLWLTIIGIVETVMTILCMVDAFGHSLSKAAWIGLGLSLALIYVSKKLGLRCRTSFSKHRWSGFVWSSAIVGLSVAVLAVITWLRWNPKSGGDGTIDAMAALQSAIEQDASVLAFTILTFALFCWATDIYYLKAGPWARLARAKAELKKLEGAKK